MSEITTTRRRRGDPWPRRRHRARDVAVRYGEVLALDGGQPHGPDRAGCGLIGMNGSGKSTLFKAIMGMVRLETGRVRLFGGAGPARARTGSVVGYVPQSEDVDWAFPVSVRDVVMMGRYGRAGPHPPAASGRPGGGGRRAGAGRADRAADRQIGQLSGGQRKRAFVARGIAQDARLLLLDEPFAGVDKRAEATIAGCCSELRGRAAAPS